MEGHSPNGTKLRIFVDAMGLVGDYPASAAVIDVIGHADLFVLFACLEDLRRHCGRLQIWLHRKSALN